MLIEKVLAFIIALILSLTLAWFMDKRYKNSPPTLNEFIFVIVPSSALMFLGAFKCGWWVVEFLNHIGG